ncbi:MAG TPA: O-antigen ligase family protein [Pirellulaceae bacterium]|nr:O-antigen ligase family protein [Pirellulaceae bacterium]
MKGLLFTYAMTYGGAVVSLISPYYGFLIYVAFANLKPEALWFWSVPQGNYSRIVAVAFLIGWLVHGGGSWKFGRAASMIAALAFFWAWITLGAAISPAKDEAWLSLTTLSKVYLPVIAGVTLIDSVQRLKQLAWVLVATQGYLALEFNQLYYAGGIDPMFWSFAGLDNNSIAITMVTSLGLAGFLGLHAERWWQKLAALVAAALMAHVVLFSMSRGGMLAMCVTGAVAFWLIPKRPVHFAMLVLAVVVVLRLAGPEVREEFFTSFADAEVRDASAQSRFDLTRDNIDVMLKNPLFGCGMDNWPNIASSYGWKHGKEGHNLWAQTGAELGIPGLASLLGFYLLGCWNLLKLTRESTPVADPWIRYCARMVIASIAGFFVSAAAVSVERVEIPYYIMVLGAGTLKLYSLGLVPAGSTPQIADSPPYAAATS